MIWKSNAFSNWKRKTSTADIWNHMEKVSDEPVKKQCSDNFAVITCTRNQQNSHNFNLILSKTHNLIINCNEIITKQLYSIIQWHWDNYRLNSPEISSRNILIRFNFNRNSKFIVTREIKVYNISSITTHPQQRLRENW